MPQPTSSSGSSLIAETLEDRVVNGIHADLRADVDAKKARRIASGDAIRKASAAHPIQASTVTAKDAR